MLPIPVVRYGLFAATICALAGAVPNLRAADAVIDGKAPEGASLSMDLNWLDVIGINQPVTPEQTVVEVTYKLNGKEVNGFIRIDADTYIWKGNNRDKGSDGALTLRDGSFSQALLRLDLAGLPKGAEIVSASLRFKIQWLERKGEMGAFFCHRLITPWTEDATWFKPQPDAPNWDGLQAGRDFEKAAFAKIEQVALDDPKGGVVIHIPHFEGMLKQWQTGTSSNNGFLLTFSSKAMQAVVPSRESLLQTRNLLLGGSLNSQILLRPNLALMDRVLMKASDLESAQPSISIAAPAKGNPPAGALKVYECDSANPIPDRLLASVPLKDIGKGACKLPELLPVFQQWMASSRKSSPALLLSVEGGNAIANPEVLVDGMRNPRKPTLTIKIHNYPSHRIFGQNPVLPQKGVYAKIENGHITYGGKRLRLWGVIGYPRADRLIKMGFNAQRIWAPDSKYCYSPESAKRGVFMPYEKGDQSKLDEADKHFAEIKASGLFVMLSALTNTIPANLLLEDDSFIAGGEDWGAWKEAMKTKALPLQHIIFVDERLQKIRKTHAKNLLTHVNPYTGKAYGEEECIALYEVFNENGFMDKILSGELEKWPPYFKTKLQIRWNEWLKKRYADDAGLLKSWGSLPKGESLANNSVLPAPDFASRTSFPEKRAADYVEFLIDLENSFNQDFRTYCRSLFPKGVGVNVAPFSFDTMYRPNIPWAYTQSLGDVHCDGMYFWNSDSSLAKPPSAYVMDSFTPAGMPTVIYETNAGRPSPYRSEYPLKLAAMASREDWDGVFWHYWGKSGGDNDAEYLPGTLGYPNPQHYWLAVYNELDPVMCSSLALAGRIFLNQEVPPAESPEVFKIGKKALFSYETFRGINTAAATFSKGSRIQYDPKDDSGITVDGKEMPTTGRMLKALAAGEHVTWDWPNERLIIDTPSVKAYVGKVNGEFRFRDGIVLSHVSTPWISFCMTSDDGKALTGSDASKRILISGVFDAKPQGFVFDPKTQGGPVEQFKGISNLGHEPILVDQVEYQVSFSNALEGVLKSYDFALREIKTTTIANGSSIAQTGGTPYMDVLEVKQWGPKSAVAADEPTRIETVDYASLLIDSGATAATAGQVGVLFPIAGLHWAMNYADSRQYLQDAPLVFTSMSKEESGASADKTIVLTDAKLPLLWNSLADVVFAFRNGSMESVEVTFKQPPSIEELITQFSKILGQPARKKLDAQFGSTEIRWNSQKQLPGIYVTEAQGIMKVLYESPKESTK